MGFVRVIWKSLATTLIFFLLIEIAVRAAYLGRNAMVEVRAAAVHGRRRIRPDSSVAR